MKCSFLVGLATLLLSASSAVGDVFVTTSDAVVIVSPARNQIIARIPTGADPLIALHPNGRDLYVASGLEGSAHLQVIDTRSREVRNALDLPGAPTVMAFARGDELLLGARVLTEQYRLLAIDAASSTVRDSVELSGELWRLALSPDSQTAYGLVSCRGGIDVCSAERHGLARIDLSPLSVRYVIRDSYPYVDLAVESTGRFVYATGRSVLQVINAADGSIASEEAFGCCGGGPLGLTAREDRIFVLTTHYAAGEIRELSVPEVHFGEAMSIATDDLSCATPSDPSVYSCVLPLSFALYPDGKHALVAAQRCRDCKFGSCTGFFAITDIDDNSVVQASCADEDPYGTWIGNDGLGAIASSQGLTMIGPSFSAIGEPVYIGATYVRDVAFGPGVPLPTPTPTIDPRRWLDDNDGCALQPGCERGHLLIPGLVALALLVKRCRGARQWK